MATRRTRTITPELIRDALGCIPPDVDRDTWARVAMAIKSELPEDAGFALFNDWSACGESYDATNARDTWRSVKPGGRTTIGSLFGIAKDHGFSFPQEAGSAVQTPEQAAAAAAEAARLAEQKRRQREASESDYRRRADKAARDAATLWAEAGEVGQSPYLVRKGVGAHGVRFLPDGTVLVPLRDGAGALLNVQRIAPERPADGGPEKRFLPGGRKSGLWHVVGGVLGAVASVAMGDAAGTTGSDAAGSPVLLLAEGYATAASVHEATGRPVVVCFDAGNLVNVAKALRELHPALPLVVCADDDCDTEARTGHNPGREKAATAARAAHTDEAPAGVVWPEGLPDGGSDFNDLAQHAGLEVVRELIERAMTAPAVPKPQRKAKPGPVDDANTAPPPEAQPAPDGAPKARQRGAGRGAAGGGGRSGGGGGADGEGSEGDDAGTAADPFILVTHEERVSERDSRCDRPGLWFLARDNEGNSKRPVWLCAPLLVSAETRTDDGNGWGLLLSFADGDHRPKTWAMPMALLNGDGAQWAGRLRDMGLRMAPGTTARNLLARFLDTRYLSARVTCTDRVGWHGGVYVLPHGSIGEREDGQRYVYQSEGGIEDAFRQQGELSDWLHHVAAPSAGNSRLVFAICCALGGPLMGPLVVQTGGFHLVGDSSLGKTTALLVAASVWGSPNFKRQWRTTDNALEATASQHSDGLLILDEISQVEGRIVGECAYMLANEQEKGRNQRSLQLRKLRTWRLLFLSSGEKSLSDHMEEAGKKANEGQLLRMPSVPADAGVGLGMLQDLHGGDDAKRFVETITKACASHYGTAGAAWLRWLADNLPEVEGRAVAIMGRFEAECVPQHAHSQVRRVAARFALVAAAGELATKAGLTGWAVGEAAQSVRQCFDAWLAKRGHSGNGETWAMLAQVKSYFEKNGDALFTPLHRTGDDHRPNTPLRVGFRRVVNDKGEPIKLDAAQEWVDRRSTSESGAKSEILWQYLCLPEGFRREVCKGFDVEAVAKMLRKRKHLVTEGDRLTVRQRVNGMGKPAVYLVKPSIFEDDFDGL